MDRAGWLKAAAGAVLLALLCRFPGEARAAAAEGFADWANTVAPALLPFLVAAPALSTQEACALYRRAFAPLMRWLGLAPEMAGAALVGLISGSPAGAAALLALSQTRPLNRGEALRCAWFASGASMGFLLSALPALPGLESMGSALVRGQLCGQLLCALLLRRAGRTQERTAGPSQSAQGAPEGTIRGAVMTLASVAGCMAFFRVLNALCVCVLGNWSRRPAAVLLELSSGCQALSSLRALPLPLRTALVSACASVGGLSVCMQCASILRDAGISLREYLPGKLLQGACCGLCTWGWACLGARAAPAIDPGLLSALAAGAAVLCLCVWAPLNAWRRRT